MKPLREVRPGQPLVAADRNAFAAELMRLGRRDLAGGELDTGAGGVLMSLPRPAEFVWGRITGRSGAAYSWRAVVPYKGQWRFDPQYRVGVAGNNPAYEANGSLSVADGTVVRLRPGATWRDGTRVQQEWLFHHCCVGMYSGSGAGPSGSGSGAASGSGSGAPGPILIGHDCDLPCNPVPLQYRIDVTYADDTCTACEGYNGGVIVTFIPLFCQWFGTVPGGCYSGPFESEYTDWTLFWNRAADAWYARLSNSVASNAGQFELATASFDCYGTNTLSRIFGSLPGCITPATVTVTAVL